MFSIGEEWNPKQSQLKSIIYKPERINEVRELAIELHSIVHEAEMTNTGVKTYEDEIWEGLEDNTFRIMPTPEDATIAWNIWHITRIEDITANILINGGTQVINSDDWLGKMNVTCTDTGNAMSDDEIIALSSAIDMRELRNYRLEVGRRTRQIISNLKPEDLKRKMEPERLQRIMVEGGVLDVSGSRWLLDFWGKKNVGGILLMPITRHQVVHISDSLKLKAKCRRKTRGLGK